MKKGIVIIGSGDYRKKECFDIDKKIVKLVGVDAHLLVIPFAITEQEKRINRFNSIKETYSELGIKNITMLDDFSMPIDKMIDEIKKSNILFLSGGDPKTLLDALEKNKLVDSILNFPGVIVGFSAGAMILPKEVLILGGIDEKYPQTSFSKGLGLVTFNISPYYNISQNEELLTLSKNRQIYALENASAIFVTKSKLKMVGCVHSYNLGV